MLMAYLNYPNPRVSVHRDPTCSFIHRRMKSQQRIYQINPETISAELRDIQARDARYQFAANHELNDLWLEVDFQDAHFEEAVVRHMQTRLGLRYEAFHTAVLTLHDCPG
jgi:hypothetical protein